MPFYVYILQSQADNTFYKGASEQPLIRLNQHNEGLSQYTSRKTPWVLVYVEECPTKKDALIREKALKKYAHSQIVALITAPKNIVANFIDPVG